MANNFLNEETTFRVCGNLEIKFLCFTENEHSSSTILKHYKCKNCGSVFVGNKIDSEELGVAYSTLNIKDYYKDIEIENKNKMKTAISYLGEIIEKNLRLLI